MKHLSLPVRLWLPTVMATLLISAMAVLIVVRTLSSVAQVNVEQAAQLRKIDLISQWSHLTEVNAMRAQGMMQVVDQDEIKRLQGEREADVARLVELERDITAVATLPAETALLARLKAARPELPAALGASATVDAKQFESLRQKMQAYSGLQADLLALEHQQARDLVERTGQDRLRTVTGVIVVMGVMLVMLMITTVLTVRSIVPALRRALRAAEQVGQGDLNTRLETSRTDEIGDLMRGLNHMTDALRSFVQEVREGVGTLQSASGEIASGNTDLSQRTEQTASNLQNTASSVSQLTQTVKHSAAAADQANQLASTAAEAAARGGEVVTQVVSNMNEISSSSRRIGDIIGVIDGIAFQTNILALNAAVEAARAGEQGRGFAVVASEVRLLAHRSAEAAREIKVLINTSMTTVDQGSRLVAQAGGTIDELVASVRHVSTVIGQITSSAMEQNDGIVHINQAITQLDDMTQQNAALVEQSAAAADSLRQEALRLNAAVQRFRLERA